MFVLNNNNVKNKIDLSGIIFIHILIVDSDIILRAFLVLAAICIIFLVKYILAYAKLVKLSFLLITNTEKLYTTIIQKFWAHFNALAIIFSKTIEIVSEEYNRMVRA